MKKNVFLRIRHRVWCVIVALLTLLTTERAHAKLSGQPLIDSLLKELPKQKEDTNMANLFCSISNGYRSINPDEGIKYGQQALGLATKLNWAKGIANADAKTGLNYQFKSDYSKAMEYYVKALQVYRETGDKNGVATVTGYIASVYLYLCDYAKALDYYLKALKIYWNICTIGHVIQI